MVRACAASFQHRPSMSCWLGAGGGQLALRHNNGMHPTADTHLVIYFHRSGAAGDAGR
jgi:hypothetical protein